MMRIGDVTGGEEVSLINRRGIMGFRKCARLTLEKMLQRFELRVQW